MFISRFNPRIRNSAAPLPFRPTVSSHVRSSMVDRGSSQPVVRSYMAAVPVKKEQNLVSRENIPRVESVAKQVASPNPSTNPFDPSNLSDLVTGQSAATQVTSTNPFDPSNLSDLVTGQSAATQVTSTNPFDPSNLSDLVTGQSAATQVTSTNPFDPSNLSDLVISQSETKQVKKSGWIQWLFSPLTSFWSWLTKGNLEAWSKENGDEGVHRMTAKERIEACRQNKSERLDLSDLQLTSLPSTVGKLRFLKRLNLSGNAFQTFPQVISKLTQLEILVIHNNPGLAVEASIRGLDNWSSPKSEEEAHPLNKLIQLRELHVDGDWWVKATDVRLSTKIEPVIYT